MNRLRRVSTLKPLNVFFCINKFKVKKFTKYFDIFSLDGAVQRMDPLMNLQVAVKNNIDVFYFSCIVPMHVLFVKDGNMGK